MLSSACPGSGGKSARMLEELIRLGFLITSLRPPMTTTDTLGHVTAELRAARAHEIPETEGLLEQLEALQGPRPRAPRRSAARRSTAIAGAAARPTPSPAPSRNSAGSRPDG
jgi:lantibiotic biosynthesis protein